MATEGRDVEEARAAGSSWAATVQEWMRAYMRAVRDPGEPARDFDHEIEQQSDRAW